MHYYNRTRPDLVTRRNIESYIFWNSFQNRCKGVLVASIYHSEDGELHIFEHESDKVPKITRDNIFNFPSDNLTKGNVDD